MVSGCVAAAIPQQNTTKIATAVNFSSPQLKEVNDYLTVTLTEMTSYAIAEGKPVLPRVVKVFDLPFGATDVSVHVTTTGVHEQTVAKDIQPGPKALPLDDNANVETTVTEDAATYASSQPYPASWFEYAVTGGLDNNFNHVTHVSVALYPVRCLPALKTMQIADSMQVTVTYQPPSHPKTFGTGYDMVIIAPRKFNSILAPLVTHKNSHGVNTTIKNVEDIYKGYSNATDKAEKVKYYIKDAIEQNGITFVMLFGGLKNKIYAIDRENPNTGSNAWYVPMRYSNLWDGAPPDVFDPGYPCDLYYSDIYTGTGSFSRWDGPNPDGIYAAWSYPGHPKDILDMDPDVYVGRLAVTTKAEAKTVVDKIISYETAASGDWEKKMVTVAGDGFQDQNDLNIKWNVNSLPTGTYTIYAQSMNNDSTTGPIDIINVTVDLTKPSNITFVEDDNDFGLIFPAPPRAEITSPSENDILGNTAVSYIPPRAYIGENWAKVEYSAGVMTIRGKSYDPRPFGVFTLIHVWIKNSAAVTVFDTQTLSEEWFESEWEVAKAESYIPSDFNITELWGSDGKLVNQASVLPVYSEGALFVYFAGHGNPRIWANHFPGIPGGRHNASIDGLANVQLSAPFLPMNKLTNGGKLPVTLIDGCHNSMDNITLLRSIFQGAMYWTYGMPVFDCFSWTLIREKNGGAIGTIGCAGLGYGYLGWAATEGLGGWMNSHFFQVWRTIHDSGKPAYLGQVHSTTIHDYRAEFGTGDQTDAKTMQEWTFLGDPSLVIGGYQ